MVIEMHAICYFSTMHLAQIATNVRQHVIFVTSIKQRLVIVIITK